MPKLTDSVELPTIGITVDWTRMPKSAEKDRRLWQAEVGALLRVAHLLAIEAFGEKRASERMKRIATRKPGRRPRQDNQLDEQYLLIKYIDAKRNSKKAGEDVFKKIGEELHRQGPGSFGNSAAAIAQKIRRLVIAHHDHVVERLRES